jgi:hypothetical protein
MVNEKTAYLDRVRRSKFTDGCEAHVPPEPADVLVNGYEYPVEGETDGAPDIELDDTLVEEEEVPDESTRTASIGKVLAKVFNGDESVDAEVETRPMTTDITFGEDVASTPAAPDVSAPVDEGAKCPAYDETPETRSGTTGTQSEMNLLSSFVGSSRFQTDPSGLKRYVRAINSQASAETTGDEEYVFNYYIYLDPKRGYANISDLIGNINRNIDSAGLSRYFALQINQDSGKIRIVHSKPSNTNYNVWSISSPITRFNRSLFSLLGWSKLETGTELSHARLYVGDRPQAGLLTRNKTYDLAVRHDFGGTNTCFLICCDLTEKQVCGNATVSEIGRIYVNEIDPLKFPEMKLSSNANSPTNVYSRRVVRKTQLITEIPFSFRSLMGKYFALHPPAQFVITLHFTRI